MTRLAALLLPLVVIVPVLAMAPQAPVAAQTVPAATENGRQGGSVSAISEPAPVRSFRQAWYPPVVRQVRIEQRVVIRISPRRSAPSQQLLSDLPREGVESRFEERRIGRCISVKDIVGVQPADEQRLILFMRDRRMIAASLDRSCSSRDFYSGFYVDRTQDGQICVNRDQLQTRSGAQCAFSQLAQLVATGD